MVPVNVPCLQYRHWSLPRLAGKAERSCLLLPQARFTQIQAGLVQYIMTPQWSLAAAVFTELTDVESEVNGIMTYDRMVSLWLLLPMCYVSCCNQVSM